MKLYIPELGDRLRLTSDWEFKLYNEHRNESLRTHFGYTTEYGNKSEYEIVTIPSGTILKVDRIYIRKNAGDYSSLSFYAEGIGNGSGAFGRPKSARFWAKLDDCNTINYEIEALSKDEPKVKPLEIIRTYNSESDYTVYYKEDRKLENLLFLICVIKTEQIYETQNYFGFTEKRKRDVISSYELKKPDGEFIKTFNKFESVKTYLRKWNKEQSIQN